MPRQNITGRDKTLYQEMVQAAMPKKKMLPQLVKAFVVGGLICCVGQAVHDLGEKLLHLNEEELSAFTAIVMVFLGATLTGIGIYDKIGKFAGAGSIVPITGFANSAVSPAMEFKREGFIMGVGAKLFSLAGPACVKGACSEGKMTCGKAADMRRKYKEEM